MPRPGENQSCVESRSKGARNFLISPERTDALIAALRGGPGNIAIDCDGGDTNSQPLCVQLQDAFWSAGWNVSSGITLGISDPPKSGILIRTNKGGTTVPQERVTRAFIGADIPLDLRLDREPRPPTGAHVHAPIGMGADDVEIVVTAAQP